MGQMLPRGLRRHLFHPWLRGDRDGHGDNRRLLELRFAMMISQQQQQQTGQSISHQSTWKKPVRLIRSHNSTVLPPIASTKEEKAAATLLKKVGPRRPGSRTRLLQIFRFAMLPLIVVALQGRDWGMDWRPSGGGAECRFCARHCHTFRRG